MDQKNSSPSYVETKSSNISTLKAFSYVTFAVLSIYFVIALAFLLANINHDCIENNTELNTFESVKDAILNGFRIRLVMDFSKSSGMKPADTKNGFDLDDYRIFLRSETNRNAFVLVSVYKFFDHPVYNFIYSFSRVQIYDNELYDRLSYLVDPKNFTFIETEYINGTLNDGRFKVLLKLN